MLNVIFIIFGTAILFSPAPLFGSVRLRVGFGSYGQLGAENGAVCLVLFPSRVLMNTPYAYFWLERGMIYKNIEIE